MDFNSKVRTMSLMLMLPTYEQWIQQIMFVIISTMKNFILLTLFRYFVRHHQIVFRFRSQVKMSANLIFCPILLKLTMLPALFFLGLVFSTEFHLALSRPAANRRIDRSADPFTGEFIVSSLNIIHKSPEISV